MAANYLIRIEDELWAINQCVARVDDWVVGLPVLQVSTQTCTCTCIHSLLSTSPCGTSRTVGHEINLMTIDSLIVNILLRFSQVKFILHSRVYVYIHVKRIVMFQNTFSLRTLHISTIYAASYLCTCTLLRCLLLLLRACCEKGDA